MQQIRRSSNLEDEGQRNSWRQANMQPPLSVCQLWALLARCFCDNNICSILLHKVFKKKPLFCHWHNSEKFRNFKFWKLHFSYERRQEVRSLRFLYAACFSSLSVPHTFLAFGSIQSPSCYFLGIKAYLILQSSMQFLMCFREGQDVVMLYKYTHLLPGCFCLSMPSLKCH